MNTSITIVTFIAIAIASGVAGFLVFYVIHKALTSLETAEQKKKHLRHKDTILEIWMKKRRTGIFSYNRIESLQLSSGEVFRQKVKGKKCETPGEFIEESFIMAFAFGIVSVGVLSYFMGAFKPLYLLILIPTAVIGFWFPKFMMTTEDKDDNKKMLPDINNMYEALKVSTTAGIPLIDGLGECYRQVKNPRLKSALSEVSAAIRGGKDMEFTINHLREQFTSPEIVQFCIVIRQSLETGRQAEILGDLSTNMREVQNEINHQIEEKLNSKVQLIQMGLLFILMFIMLYAVVTTMMTQIVFN